MFVQKLPHWNHSSYSQKLQEENPIIPAQQVDTVHTLLNSINVSNETNKMIVNNPSTPSHHSKMNPSNRIIIMDPFCKKVWTITKGNIVAISSIGSYFIQPVQTYLDWMRVILCLQVSIDFELFYFGKSAFQNKHNEKRDDATVTLFWIFESNPFEWPTYLLNSV